MSYPDHLGEVRNWFVDHPGARPPDTLGWNDEDWAHGATWQLKEEDDAGRLFFELDQPGLEWETKSLGREELYILCEQHPVFGEVTIFLSESVRLPDPRILFG